ncbi:MAG: HAD family phosphatase [Lachnospiraceae bacterium]|nr:HAD family phosphatase [Lachnospiraceae bacterium]
MIKNIVFDMAEVMLLNDPADYISTLDIDHSKDEMLRNAALDIDFFADIDQGRMQDMAAGIEEYKKRYPDISSELDAYVAGPWREGVFLAMPGMPELVERLKEKGFGVYLLTNFGKTDMDFVRRTHHFEELFDGVLVSAEEGVWKPDPAFYRLLTERFGIDLTESVFADDNPANVRAAEELGMTGIVFKGREAFLQELSKYIGEI